MNVRYRVQLSQTERDQLSALLSGARFDQMLATLRRRSIAEGWTVDDRQAARARRCFVSRANRVAREEDEAAAIEFIGQHGQSFDWIICGDPVRMICAGASRSQQAATVDPIFAAIELHRTAAKRWSVASLALAS
jgi:hypothetical protein